MAAAEDGEHPGIFAWPLPVDPAFGLPEAQGIGGARRFRRYGLPAASGPEASANNAIPLDVQAG